MPVQRAMQNFDVSVRESYRLWILFTIGLILVYSKWWAWHGDLFWGPRFFLIACIPASLVLAVRAYDGHANFLSNMLTFGALLLSFWVGLNGVVFKDISSWGTVCSENGWNLQSLCWYTPEFSTLWKPFVDLKKIELNVFERSLVFSWLLVSIYTSLPLLINIMHQAFKYIARHVSDEKWFHWEF